MSYELLPDFIESLSEYDYETEDTIGSFLSDFIEALPDDINVVDVRDDGATYHFRLERNDVEICVPLAKSGSIEKTLALAQTLFAQYEDFLRETSK